MWPGPPCNEGDGGSVSSNRGILHNAAFNSALLSLTTKLKIIGSHVTKTTVVNTQMIQSKQLQGIDNDSTFFQHKFI